MRWTKFTKENFISTPFSVCLQFFFLHRFSGKSFVLLCVVYTFKLNIQASLRLTQKWQWKYLRTIWLRFRFEFNEVHCLQLHMKHKQFFFVHCDFHFFLCTWGVKNARNSTILDRFSVEMICLLQFECNPHLFLLAYIYSVSEHNHSFGKHFNCNEWKIDLFACELQKKTL